MKIAIFGGSFDPPHWGHYWVAQQVLDFGPEIDEVWLMPCFVHPWRKDIASPEDRLAMIRCFNNKKIRVSDYEIRKAGTSYTLDTIRGLRKIYKDQFFWLVGSDLVSGIAKWYQAQKLAQEVRFIVFPRIGYPIKPTSKNFIEMKSNFLLTSNLSSTTIRKRTSMKMTLRGFVPDAVEEYILKKGLYR